MKKQNPSNSSTRTKMHSILYKPVQLGPCASPAKLDMPQDISVFTYIMNTLRRSEDYLRMQKAMY